MRLQTFLPKRTGECASETRKDFAAARTFYLTILVISLFAVWRLVIPGDPLGKADEDAGLQKRERLATGELVFTRSDKDVRTIA